MNLPKEFLQNMQGILKENFPKYLSAMEKAPVNAMRLNRLKSTTKDLEKFDVIKKVDWSNSVYEIESNKIGKHPYHIAGLVYVQEPSSMLAVESSGLEEELDKENLCVLDLCAAPGGKTGQIAEILAGQGVLVSNEIDHKRARVLQSNVERMGYTNVVITNASPNILAQNFKGKFDYIFVDAPCGGEGMFRKDPDTIAQWNNSAIESNSQRQKEILVQADKMLKNGGRIVYSTCTFNPKEDEDIALWLKQNYDYKLCDLPQKITQNTTWLIDPKCRRFYPHVASGEGQFVCVLQKQTEQEDEQTYSKNIKIENSKIINDYINNNFDLKFAQNCIKVGENYCLVTEKLQKMMFLLKNVPIINAGVTVGSVQKDRVIPHNNMFTAYGDYAKNKLNLDFESDELKKFLHGEELQNQFGFSGYVCILVDGHPIGFTKATGPVLKNMFPKGLRI